MNDPLILFIYIIVFLYSVILHEIAHGFVARWFGDDTAHVAGRLSFNPIVHIDPIGSILVPAILYLTNAGFLFGWAKPVPVNPYNLRRGAHPYRWVSLAGIITNLSLALIAGAVLSLATQQFGLAATNVGVIVFSLILSVNIALAVFNSIPLPGFDGFNFLNTFSPINRLLEKTPLNNPIFLAQYGLFISMILLFILLPYIQVVMQVIMAAFLTLFGLA